MDDVVSKVVEKEGAKLRDDTGILGGETAKRVFEYRRNITIGRSSGTLLLFLDIGVVVVVGGRVVSGGGVCCIEPKYLRQ